MQSADKNYKMKLKLKSWHLPRSMIIWCFTSATFFMSVCTGDEGYACDREIYCKGELLHTVQMARLYNDSKTFVDMVLKDNSSYINELFAQLNSSHNGDIPKDALQTFVDENFYPAGQELDFWTPDDWVDSPALLNRINDATLRQWAKNMNDLWKTLGRKMNQTVYDHPELHSLIPAENPFIVPGDRFREFYYWDTLWIVEGLLRCGMNNTVKGMIENFLHLINTIGHIPNGGRVYYEKRSQPPMITPMVDLYYENTKNLLFIASIVGTLDKEYDFWMNNRNVNVTVPGQSNQHVLNRYYVSVTKPRPEGYREDEELMRGLSDADRGTLQAHIASSCESGWDFSTRWFSGSTLNTTKTRNIVPVDLNTYLLWNENILSKFHNLLGNNSKQGFYQNAAARRKNAIYELMWNEAKGAWFDYDLDTQLQRVAFNPTTIFPLFVEAYGDTQDRNNTVRKVLQYLKESGVLDYPAGVPTTLVHSGQQWDFPNAWPPLIDLTIASLNRTGHQEAVQSAFDLAQKWLTTNYRAYERFTNMFEKYDVRTVGEPGGGGEYVVLIGFGWTNGVVLKLIDIYADRMTLLPVPYTGLSAGIIAAIVVGSVAAVSLSAALIVYLVKSKHKGVNVSPGP